VPFNGNLYQSCTRFKSYVLCNEQRIESNELTQQTNKQANSAWLAENTITMHSIRDLRCCWMNQHPLAKFTPYRIQVKNTFFCISCSQRQSRQRKVGGYYPVIAVRQIFLMGFIAVKK
jgi:hypothetical protein